MHTSEKQFRWWLFLTSASLMLLSATASIKPPPPVANTSIATTQTLTTTSPSRVLAARTIPLVVNHESIDLFDQIPEEYLETARNLRMLFINRSVGSNINDGLTCLSYPSVASAPNHCKRPTIESSELVAGSQYDRSNWEYQFWDSPFDNGLWTGMVRSFIDMVTPQIDDYDVFSFQMSYLEVVENSTIDDPTGFFYDNPNAIQDIHDLARFEEQHPTKTFYYMTSSLSRSIGTLDSQSFNQQMRDYTQTNNKVLLDVADILSHNPQGVPCFDNRDGVPYSFNTRSENYPNDQQDIPAICAEYTTEIDGGHLGSHSTGKVRVAKAMWVLMAQLSGWEPNTNTTFPTPIPSSTIEPSPSPLPSPTASPIPLSTPTTSATLSPTTPPTSDTNASLRLHFDNPLEATEGCPQCEANYLSFTASGKINGSYLFNQPGSNLIVHSSIPIKNSQQFSVALWLKPQFTSTDTNIRYVLSDGNSLALFYLPSTKSWRATLRTSGGFYRLDMPVIAWNNDEWHHLAVTYNNQHLYLYWDGQLKSQQPVTGTVSSDSLPFVLGQSSVKSHAFLGSFDEVVIYPTALSASQISSLSSP